MEGEERGVGGGGGERSRWRGRRRHRALSAHMISTKKLMHFGLSNTTTATGKPHQAHASTHAVVNKNKPV